MVHPGQLRFLARRQIQRCGFSELLLRLVVPAGIDQRLAPAFQRIAEMRTFPVGDGELPALSRLAPDSASATPAGSLASAASWAISSAIGHFRLVQRAPRLGPGGVSEIAFQAGLKNSPVVTSSFSPGWPDRSHDDLGSPAVVMLYLRPVSGRGARTPRLPAALFARYFRNTE
jgi:hypothetical protein